MKKVLFDTDIGNDIDDALALAYLLKEPECELLGITTVSGEPYKRAMLASVLCHRAGRDDIPIYVGMEGPFLGRQRQPKAYQAEKLCNWEHGEDFPQYGAVDFMRRTIRENPHEVTLIAVGPLTNIATLFKVDPEIPSLLEGLVLMCGDFEDGTQTTEWNALCDWVATAVIYNSKVKLHRSFGLNVTNKVSFERADVDKKLTGLLMAPVRDFTYKWDEFKFPAIVFHDPLAAMAVFHPEICEYKKGTVRIDTERQGSLG